MHVVVDDKKDGLDGVVAENLDQAGDQSQTLIPDRLHPVDLLRFV